MYKNEAGHNQDDGLKFNNGLHVSFDAIISGQVIKPMFSNPMVRFNQDIATYGHEHDNMDDARLYKTDNFERLKPRMPKKGSTVGTTTLLPIADTDEKLYFYDTQGESLYTNPPDPNVPVVDHGHDENHIWSFHKSVYNQNVIDNPYTRGIRSTLHEHRAPWWGKKLATPAFYTDAKYQKFWEQYAIKIEFELLKLKHASELRNGDMK